MWPFKRQEPSRLLIDSEKEREFEEARAAAERLAANAAIINEFLKANAADYRMPNRFNYGSDVQWGMCALTEAVAKLIQERTGQG